MTFTETISFSCRTYFSIQHIQSSAYFSRQALEFERKYSGEYSDELFSQHRAYVSGAILSSIAFLEAAINELFEDAIIGKSTLISELNNDRIKLLAANWKSEKTEKLCVLDKFKTALELSKLEPFDTSTFPYQDITLLVKLRNDLVHYKPKSSKAPMSDDFNSEDIHIFEKRLKNKFPLNPLTSLGNPFFPDKCLSYGCSQWAVQSCIKFADLFYSKMGMANPYEHIRNRLAAN